MQYDPIETVETLYRTDLTGDAWLQEVIHSVQPLVDPQRSGMHGGFFTCPDALSFVPAGLVNLNLSDRMATILFDGMQSLSADFVAGTFLSPGVVKAAGVDGWNEISTVRDGRLAAVGIDDVLNVVAVEPEGSGCLFAHFHPRTTTLRSPETQLLRGVFRHFVAAHRLQRNRRGSSGPVDSAAAVLDSNARIHHAQGAAKDAAFQAALRAAVTRSETSRGQRRMRDPHAALDAWESLVAGRWTLVDHFDHDGRRYILALENSPRPCGWDLLSAREREIVERASRGLENKVIAYELGLEHSTVRVLMKRAAFKLGVRTRHELIAKLSRSRTKDP